MMTIERAGRFSVRDLEKEGYAFDRNTSAYFASTDREEMARHTSKHSPLILTMRKKGEPTFLIHKKGRVDFQYPEDVRTLDLLDGKSIRFREKQNESDVLPWDLKVTGTFLEETQEWLFIITSSVQDGVGIFVSESVLYEAPETGFKTEFRQVIQLNNLRNSLFVYIKSRTPPLYSRVVLQFSPGKEKCIMGYESWLNPFGLRNLEYDVS